MDSLEYLDPQSINGLNLYAYCGNNPVMNIDPSGQFFFTFMLIAGIVASAAVVGGVVGGITSSVNGGNFWEGFGLGVVSGLSILGGAVLMPFIPHAGASLVGFGVGSLFGGASNLANGGSYFAGWLGGGVNGTFNALGTSLGMPWLGGFLGGFTGNIITQKIDTGLIDWSMAVSSGVLNMVFNQIAKFNPNLSPFARSIYFSIVGTVSSGITELVWKSILPFRFW